MSLITDPWDDDDVQVEELDSRFKKIRTVQHRTVSTLYSPWYRVHLIRPNPSWRGISLTYFWKTHPIVDSDLTQIEFWKTHPDFLPKAYKDFFILSMQSR